MLKKKIANTITKQKKLFIFSFTHLTSWGKILIWFSSGEGPDYGEDFKFEVNTILKGTGHHFSSLVPLKGYHSLIMHAKYFFCFMCHIGERSKILSIIHRNDFLLIQDIFILIGWLKTWIFTLNNIKIGNKCF